MTTTRTDVVIIGAGIVGLATAWKLQQIHPRTAVTVLEKETEVAEHQTGHNSGVIHSGIYYQPGSLKAVLSRRGAAETKQFAAEHGIPFETTGKLLVATDEVELERMHALHERALENELEVELLDQQALRALEPHVAGIGAILVPATGIIDYALVCRTLARLIVAGGGQVLTGQRVTGIVEDSDSVTVSTTGASWRAEHLIACAGLQADRIAKLAGIRTDVQIIPFRGEYYRLPDSRKSLVKHLIYPIPDPDLPFLGVHLSPTIDGGLTVGPNAVLGLAREKYPKWKIDLRDVATYATFPGMWRACP